MQQPKPDPKDGQVVTVEGRVIFQQSAFVGHSFEDKDMPVVEFFKNVLEELFASLVKRQKLAL
jgi:hypothetical protein